MWTCGQGKAGMQECAAGVAEELARPEQLGGTGVCTTEGTRYSVSRYLHHASYLPLYNTLGGA